MKTIIKSGKGKGLLLIISLFSTVLFGQVDSAKVPARISDSIKVELTCVLIPQVSYFPPIDTTSTSINISFEYRPRTELRNGFRQ
ncbi:MAG: hypothetical protein ACO3EE_09315, partial [Flavobacteriales bacterium]